VNSDSVLFSPLSAKITQPPPFTSQWSYFLSQHLIKSTLVVSALTLVSRILGFVRDIVIAHSFGASANTDAFLVAFKIPNFMRRLFGEGAFSQAFIPVLTEYKTHKTPAEIKALTEHVAGSLGGLLLIVTLIGVFAAPLLVLIFAPGFLHDAEKFALTVELLKITFPYLLFIALTAFAGSLLNTYGKFAVPSFTPVILNLCMISATLWAAPYFEQPIIALAWGVFIAGILQLLFQLPALHHLGLLPRPRLNRQDPGVKRIYQLMIPALFGVSVTQINLLIDTLMASFLVTGSVSWLYYSDRLMEFPVGVFGLALATVTLPSLSKNIAKGDMTRYSYTLDWALRWVFLIALPATCGLIFLAAPILTTLFHNGQFNQHDVLMTSYSLIAYSVGLPGFILIKVLASGFYSRQDTRTPVKIAVIAMISNMILNLSLILFLKHAGLALATSLSALLNAGLLYYFLRKQQVFQPQTGWSKLLLRITIASLGMSFILYLSQGTLADWLSMSNWERAYTLILTILLGLISYLILLFTTGFRLSQAQLKT